MIETATANDIAALSENWRLCFGDSDEYIAFFMQNRFVPADTLVARENGAVVSQLFLLPGAVRLAGETHPAHYLYAAATRPEWRGKGHMARLIGAARAYARGRAVEYIALVPGEASLYDYYARHGFLRCFTYKTLEYSRAELKEIAAKAAPGHEYGTETGAADAATITALRDSALRSRDAFLWDERAVRYALREHLAYRGGSVCAVRDGELRAWMLTEQRGGAVYVSECVVADGDFPCAAKALLDACDATRFEFRLHEKFAAGKTADVCDGGMILPVVPGAEAAVLRSDAPYIGLFLG